MGSRLGSEDTLVLWLWPYPKPCSCKEAERGAGPGPEPDARAGLKPKEAGAETSRSSREAVVDAKAAPVVSAAIGGPRTAGAPGGGTASAKRR